MCLCDLLECLPDCLLAEKITNFQLHQYHHLLNSEFITEIKVTKNSLIIIFGNAEKIRVRKSQFNILLSLTRSRGQFSVYNREYLDSLEFWPVFLVSRRFSE